MKLSIGIVGLPNVGKSTLFKIITKNEVNIANYPFCTIDPNVGVVSVPDDRLDKLAVMSSSAKKIAAIIEFYDIAGLVKGASSGEGLGNQFLSHIKETEVIVQVLRCFSSEEIIHVENRVDPVSDLEIINTELILKDLDVVTKRFAKIDAEIKSGNKQAIKNKEVLAKLKEILEKGELISDFKDEIIVKELQLLTAKKQIYFLNGKSEDVSDALKQKIASLNSTYVVSDLGTVENIPELIKKAYEVLDLISFFTTGEEETRAWTIKKGWKAPQASGVIHTDFEKKFIRAEVVSTNKLLECGSWVKAKEKGLIRIEGKEYEVKDGDVLVVRHS
ncbi:MAG: redox-regulated ATPase YchF [Candidatus Pacebacteria bacterium]|nr:redox-regulated ATPase YchF [Candidatus Paceibacterota bacterium]